jgi:Protein of unknown function (DUF3237)
MRRRTFAKLWTAAAGAAIVPVLVPGEIAAGTAARDTPSPSPSVDDGQLQSEFLLDLILERGPANNVGSPGLSRVVVPVAGGSFEGPKLKGVIVAPSGDWILARPDGSSVLDLRVVLQTDDGQNVYMSCREIAYTEPGGTLYARILPVFETSSPRYAWLNNIVAVGVYRQLPGKIAYRIYRIL